MQGEDINISFEKLIEGKVDFDGLTIELFSNLSEADIAIYFDVTNPAGATFKARIMTLRKLHLLKEGEIYTDIIITLLCML